MALFHKKVLWCRHMCEGKCVLVVSQWETVPWGQSKTGNNSYSLSSVTYIAHAERALLWGKMCVHGGQCSGDETTLRRLRKKLRSFPKVRLCHEHQQNLFHDLLFRVLGQEARRVNFFNGYRQHRVNVKVRCLALFTSFTSGLFLLPSVRPVSCLFRGCARLTQHHSLPMIRASSTAWFPIQLEL